MMYDKFSDEYDLFVNWPSRLGYEMPFIERQLSELRSKTSLRILDAACGTGMHAVALAEKGYEVSGADLSPAMVAKAVANAAAAGVKARFEATGFGGLHAVFGDGYDAILCLGNSLPHLLTPGDLAAALADFTACLRPGGLLLVQNRNFDAVVAEKTRWMEPQSAVQGPGERVYLRFYDFRPDGLIDFNILTLSRESGGPWKQTVQTTPLRPLATGEMKAALQATGFDDIQAYGSMAGEAYGAAGSGNLVIVARRA